MRNFFLTLISIWLLSIPSFAQSGPCPNISVVGPSQIMQPGEIAEYRVEIEDKGSFPGLKYQWLVSHGSIVSGQGTTAITVRQPEDQITATVNITGLPYGCDTSFSETTIREYGPLITHLDQIAMPASDIASDRIEAIRDSARTSRGASIYVISHFVDASRDFLTSRAKDLGRQIVGLNSGSINVTNVDCPGDDDLIDIYLVPPGSTPPTCAVFEEPAKSEKLVCPTLSIIGPNGITHFDEPARLAAKVTPLPTQALRYAWSLSSGNIISDPTASEIKIQANGHPDCKGMDVTVELQVNGLGDACPSSATETVHFYVDCDIFPLDTYRSSVFNSDEKGRFDNLAVAMSKWPTSKAFVIFEARSDASAKAVRLRVKKIKQFIALRKYPIDRFVFKLWRSDKDVTKMWLWPSDAGNLPECPDCETL